jgi:RHS repeat-associated protein
VMDDTSRIAEIRVGDVFPTDINDSITYILEDQIGSSVMRLSISGTVIDEEEYYPFGDSSLRTFTYKRYRYVGKEKDAESGLYYYGARYYTAWTCRFISVDPLAGKYAQLSPYNYADNNPINDYDIDGMQNNNSDNSQQSQNQQNGQQPNTQNGQPYNPYASSGIQTRTTPKPAGRWGRIACDACELDVLRNNPNAMNIGTEGKIFYAPGVDVTGRMIWVKPQITPNINTVVTTTPTGPGIVGNPIGPPAALQVPVNFNSGTNVLAPTGGAAINNAVTALNVQGGVFQPNGNPITVVGPTSQPVPATDLMSESTNQVTISNQPGQVAGQTTMFTLDLSTARQQTPQATALLNARYNTIRGQMIAAGVPAANISMGTLRYGQTAAQMGGDPNNSTTFRAQQFQVNTPAIQTTTTTTITNYTY